MYDDPDELEQQLRRTLRAAIPPIDDAAPGALKARYSEMMEAFVNLKCPECLAWGEFDIGVEHRSLNMDHLATCPLHPQAVADLAQSLGYPWQLAMSVPPDDAEQAAARSVENLGIEWPGES